jgi:ribosomal protein S18 acetylase RimI-like enzyme
MTRVVPGSGALDAWRPLSELDWTRAASAFNASYSGYVIPVHVSAQDLCRRAQSESVDRKQSYVVFESESPVGIVLIARRGMTSRIAALGVAPERRHSGLGRAMLARALAEATEREDLTMELEVFESNIAALKLYEATGFRTVDRLLGFELVGRQAPTSFLLRQDGFDRIAALLAADSSNSLPWQLALETLTKLAPPWTVVSQDDGAFAVVDLSREDAVLLRLLHTAPKRRLQGLARRLIEALMTQAGGRPIRVPQLIPARHEGFAHRLGFTTSTLRQRRMMLEPVEPSR